MSTNTKHKRRGKKRSKPKNNNTLLPFYHKGSFHTWAMKGMPPYITVDLHFVDFVVIGAGASSGYSLYNPNSYIPKYSGTQAAAEFTTWATLYDFYRVTLFACDIEMVNQDTTTAISAYVIHNENPAGASIGDLLGNAHSGSRLLGTSAGGSSKSRFRKSISMSTLVGSDAPETADSYRAVINANPADVAWMSINAYGTGTMTSGVACTVKVMQRVTFYVPDLTAQQTAPSRSTFSDDLTYLHALWAVKSKKYLKTTSQKSSPQLTPIFSTGCGAPQIIVPSNF